MTDQAMADDLRAKIIANPDVLLEDPDVMRALVGANDEAQGGNVVDLRAVAMERLEARLDRLEETHRTVIAAAYANLAGTNQVHRAILRMMEPATFPQFLHDLHGEVADILRVDAMRLVVESDDPDKAGLSDTQISVMPEGFVEGYITLGRGVSIHRQDCGNFLNLRSRHPERVIEVDWGESPDAIYPAELVVQAFDRQGLLRDISTVLADEQVSVEGPFKPEHYRY